MLQLKWEQPPNDYPTSDGKPMAETDFHRDQMMETILTLEHHYKNNPDVYVSGNILWFYRQGDKRRHVSPDVLICLGIPKGKRNNFLQWEEGRVPQVVIELTSKTTRRDDLGRKLFLYEDLGVEEYYLFDPLAEYLKPRFQAYKRHGELLVSVIGEALWSKRLGLELFVKGDKLRFRNPKTGQVLLTPTERADIERERADLEWDRAESEKERADIERGRADIERGRADIERDRADSERERAESERDRAQRAESEAEAVKLEARRAQEEARLAELRTLELEAQVAELRRRLQG